MRTAKALFAPVYRTELPAFAMPALRLVFAAVIAGVAAVVAPKDITKAAAYDAPRTVSIEISAMPAAQEVLSAEQARGPQFDILKLA